MLFEEFQNKMMISLEDICLEIFKDNKYSIKIKNPKIGVKKLVKIIEAALSISNEKGFHAMSLRELCRESGLSMGGLYAYIDSKDELWRVIQDQGRRMLKKIMFQNLVTIDQPAGKLESAIRMHLYLSEMMQPWFFFSYMETRFFRKDEKKLALSNELFTEKIFSDILEEGLKKGVFRSIDTLLTASVIKAMLQDWYLKRWKYASRNITVDEYADFIVAFTTSFTAGTYP
jgi:TetR/AcrR family transcriptional regulator, cholesterol catabolism regulator